MLGSSYATLKNAIVTQLQARPGLVGVAVNYQAPVQAEDIQASTGTSEAIWLDDADGDIGNTVICGLPLQLEDEYNIMVVIQVLRPESAGTQYAADLRCDELVGEFLHELAHDPTWGLNASGQFVHLRTTQGPYRRITGFLPGGAGHGARFEMNLIVQSRLSFT